MLKEVTIDSGLLPIDRLGQTLGREKDREQSGRTQQVKIGNSDSLSSLLPYTSGILQGSVLGTILFIFFLNNLTNINKFRKLMLYADDVTLYATVNNIIHANHLQADLSNITIWSHK